MNHKQSKIECSTLHMRYGISPKQFDFLALGGFSSIEEAKQERAKVQSAFLSYIKKDDYAFAIPYQNHRTNITAITTVDLEEAEYPLANESKQRVFSVGDGIDGLYTSLPQIVLGVTVADCTGIVLYDESSAFFAVLHSGWKGSVGYIEEGKQTRSIVRTCIEDCVPSSTDISSLKVWLSPCAKSCCYEVGNEFLELFSKYPGSIVQREGKIFLDNASYIKSELLDMGILNAHISVSDDCTICQNKYHSHRRSAKNNIENAGRALVYAYFEPYSEQPQEPPHAQP